MEPDAFLQRVVAYHAGPEGNVSAIDMDRSQSDLTFPVAWVAEVRETTLVFV